MLGENLAFGTQLYDSITITISHTHLCPGYPTRDLAVRGESMKQPRGNVVGFSARTCWGRRYLIWSAMLDCVVVVVYSNRLLLLGRGREMYNRRTRN